MLVAGDSGVGKSSLCRAGVLAQVQAGALGLKRLRPCQSVNLFPGQHPVRALADALAGVLDVSSEALQAELLRGPVDLVRRLHQYSSKQDQGGLCLRGAI